MADRSEPAGAATDREIIATRVFDAPRELVFTAWTAPKHIGKWWGPKGFTNTIHEMDVRPGGVWRFVMHGPDGRDYPNRIVFREIVPPERIVLYHESTPGFEMTATFAAEGERTRVTIRMLFDTAEERERAIKHFGAGEGLQQNIDRLGEHLPRMIPIRRTVVFTREFAAPRSLVFRAWTDATHLASWWGPKGFTNPVCETDPRPGGAIRIHMRGPDGTVHPMKGMFLEVLAPERVVFIAQAHEDAEGNPQIETFNTAIFSERDGKTTLTLRAVVVGSTPEVVGPIGGMEEGWSQSLDRLADDMAAVRA